MQNSGQGTDEATAISAGDTNNSGASNGGDPDDDDPEEARRPKTEKVIGTAIRTPCPKPRNRSRS